MTLAELRKQAIKSLGRGPHISKRKLRQWLLESSPDFELRVKELRAAILAKLLGPNK